MQLTEDQIRRIARQEGKKIVNGGSGMVIGGGSGSGSSENAREAQHAKEADHALQADKAASADKATEADHAKEADHATKAAGLDDAAQTAMDNKYLRKDQDDETAHKLTMGEAEVKGDATVNGDLKLGANGTYSISKEGVAKLAGVVAEYLKSSDFQAGTAMGFDGKGYGITKGTDGKYTLEIDNLIARMKMVVAELEVHEMSFIGGTVVLSPCGNRVDRVEALDANGHTITTDGTAVDRYRCYFLASDGDRQIKNEWTVGQLARAKTNNIAKPGDYKTYENRDYWRLVVGVSSDPVTIDGKAYHYFDLSNNTASGMTLTVTEGGESKTYTVNFPGVDPTLNSVPMAGDNVIGLGHAWDDSRKNAAMISADENIGWTLYKGVNTYSLGDEFVVNKFSINETVVTTDHFILRPYAAPTETQTVTVMRGAYDNSKSYGHNDLVTYGGQVWICTVNVGDTVKGTAPSLTGDGANYWAVYVAKGADGKTVRIDSTKYKVKDSDTALDTVDWDNIDELDGMPTDAPEKGHYRYVLTIVHYTDGSTTGTVTTSYTPNDGKGMSTETSVTYAVTDDSKQPDDALFTSTDVPADIRKGQYLWCRTIVMYKGENENTVTSYSVSRIGMDGDTGQSLHVLYSDMETPDSIGHINTIWKDGYDYMYVYTDDDVNDNPSMGLGKTFKRIKGEKGDTAVYTLEAMSDNYDAGNVNGDWVHTSYVNVNGKKVSEGNINRGHNYFFLRGDTNPTVVYKGNYDTYGETDSLATSNTKAFADFLTGTEADAYKDCVLVIVGHDALSVNTALQNALKSYGYGGDSKLYNISRDRTSFVFIGQKGMTPGTAYYQMGKDLLTLSASVVGGVLTGKGADGAPGADGKDGAPGKDGKDGKDGAAGYSYAFSVLKKVLRVKLPTGSGEISNNGFTLEWDVDMSLYKLDGKSGNVTAVTPESFNANWVQANGNDAEGKPSFSTDINNIKCSGSASYDITSDTRISQLRIEATIGGNVVARQIIDVEIEAGSWLTKTNEALSMGVENKDSIAKIDMKADSLSLKVQDLQNGGIDMSKPHTSSQVDFTTLDSSNFYPVMIKLKDDDGVRHTVEINRPLNAAYGSGKGYMTHGQGFSFRLVFSDIANAWGSYEDGQLRIESISQFCTTPSDTPICPKIAQYYPFSFMVVWLRGGSKYDVTVDCTDAYISGIWPYMMQVASYPWWVPEAVRLANDTWTTAQVGNPYNLLKHDDGGYYADTTNEYLYRFGKLTAGNTFAIVGQPSDSKQWFMAAWHITNVSGSKVYVDTSTCSITWQAQNPLGIRMNGWLGYIKTGASYAKSKWDSESGFGSSVSIDNTAVHANWVAPRSILVIGTESGTGRDRAVLESVNSCSEGSSVSFFSGTYFDVSPLYGTDGLANVETDMLATGIDIKNKKIMLTADTTVVRSNNGTQIALFGMSPNGVPFLNTNLINAESITVNRFMAFNDSTMLTSINYNGCGEFIQYYPDGKKKMEIADGNIIYYNDDTSNTTKWVIGENGTSQSIDSWSVFKLCKTDSDGSNVKTTSTLSGETYSEFRAGANSINTKYNGLTVSGRQTGTSPTALGITKIEDGWYTNTAAAFVMSNQNSYGNATGFPTASRMLYEYKDGYKTGNMKTIKWLVQAENTIA